MAYKKIILEKKNAMAKITLNRPESLNAMDIELLAELAAALDEIDKDDSVRVVILTGAGRAFSAGRDVKAMAAGEGKPGRRFYEALEAVSKPVIAAVNGYCFTGALELVMCADIIIASENAVFGDTHARFGLIPGGGQTQRLPREIGVHKAKELMFTCDRISASEAERIGIVNKVVPPEKLEEAALEMAEKIMKNVPKAVSVMKSLINKGIKKDLETALEMEAEAHAEVHKEPSALEERKRRINGFLKK